MRKILIIIAIVALTATGCGGGPKQILQHSPQVNQIDNEYFTLIVTPHRVADQIVGFDLVIRNKSGHDIEIDWDKTLYIDNGRTFGRFWSEEIRYSERNDRLPPDIVFQKSIFKKTIWPSALIVPRGAKMNHTPMDAGEHGIYLTVRISGRELSEKATFHLSAAE